VVVLSRHRYFAAHALRTGNYNDTAHAQEIRTAHTIQVSRCLLPTQLPVTENRNWSATMLKREYGIVGQMAGWYGAVYGMELFRWRWKPCPLGRHDTRK
jgi:hypothetical protein